MLNDVYDSIKLSLYERMASPIAGSFVLAWTVVNYQFWLILFSGVDIERKLEILSLYVNEHELNSISWRSFGIPLTVSLIYTFIYPYALNLIAYMTKHAKLQGNELRKAISDESLIPYSLFEEHKRKARDSASESDQEIARKEAVIKKISDENVNHLKEIDDLNAEISSLETERKKLSLEILASQNDVEKLKDQILFSTLKSDNLLAQSISAKQYQLIFNPATGSKKPIQFEPDGSISLGGNENETKWRIKNGLLEILNSAGEVHNRFNYDGANKYVSTDETQVGAIKKHGMFGQYLELVGASYK